MFRSSQTLILAVVIGFFVVTGTCVAGNPIGQELRRSRELMLQQLITRGLLVNERGIYFQRAVPRLDARGRPYFADRFVPPPPQGIQRRAIVRRPKADNRWYYRQQTISQQQ